MNTEELLNGFLKELTELCEKYKMTIEGGGCCGETLIYDNHGLQTICHEGLYYDDEEKIYKVRLVGSKPEIWTDVFYPTSSIFWR